MLSYMCNFECPVSYMFLVYFILFMCLGLGLVLVAAGAFLYWRRGGLLSSCGVWASHRGGFSVAEHGLKGAWASVVSASWLQSTGSRAAVHVLSCSAACGIFPDQGLNPCLLH